MGHSRSVMGLLYLYLYLLPYPTGIICSATRWSRTTAGLRRAWFQASEFFGDVTQRKNGSFSATFREKTYRVRNCHSTLRKIPKTSQISGYEMCAHRNKNACVFLVWVMMLSFGNGPSPFFFKGEVHLIHSRGQMQ